MSIGGRLITPTAYTYLYSRQNLRTCQGFKQGHSLARDLSRDIVCLFEGHHLMAKYFGGNTKERKGTEHTVYKDTGTQVAQYRDRLL